MTTGLHEPAYGVGNILGIPIGLLTRNAILRIKNFVRELLHG
jgi:hypothetical protein